MILTIFLYLVFNIIQLKKMIYLDNNATTQIHPEVLDIVNYYLKEHWGNPSSNYTFGAREKNAIENARASVANLINAGPSEIIFTSCATESNNTAFHAAIQSSKNKKHIITSAVEHSSIMEICKNLENNGYKITYLKVNEDGMVNTQDLENSISAETCLVSLMWANNETGVIFPIKEISEICQKKKVLFHCDAVQAVGKMPIDLKNIHIDYLSIAGHKFAAPKGIGALYIKNGSPISPFILGGGQEFGYRGGTYNTAFIVGLGKAAELAFMQIDSYVQKVKNLRDYFENKISECIPTVYFNGRNSARVPNTSNIGISGIDSAITINYLSQYEIFISSGSACSSQVIEPSHVIQAMKNYDKATETLRISLSASTTSQDIDFLIESVKNCIIKAKIQ